MRWPLQAPKWERGSPAVALGMRPGEDEGPEGKEIRLRQQLEWQQRRYAADARYMASGEWKGQAGVRRRLRSCGPPNQTASLAKTPNPLCRRCPPDACTRMQSHAASR